MEREDWDRKYEETEPLFGAEPNRFLLAEVEGLEPGRALDLACGRGRNAVWLAERGWRVTGVDFSEVALRQARHLAAGRCVEVEWVLADLREYQPPADAYDLVLVLYLHVPAVQRRAILERAVASLAPGGTLLLIGHDLSNLGTGAPGPSKPAILYTPEDIVAELPGLRIERAERVLRPVETEAGEVQAIDALVRATEPPR